MRILFACVPADGHFNPLTGVAVHLRERGHELAWYTGPSYRGRVERLGVDFHPYRRAREITGENLSTLFPERAKPHGPKLIRFDGEQVFLANVPAYGQDIRDIDARWPFDVLFCDPAFFGARPVRQLLGKRVLMLNPMWESMADDPLLPPAFLGLPPARGPLRRLAYRGAKSVMNLMVNRHLAAAYNAALASLEVDPVSWSVFDDPVRTADAFFLNGVPGLAYPRSRTEPTTVYLGACLPYRDPGRPASTSLDRADGRRTVLVSQGTVDNHDPGKLIVPTLKALAGSGFRVLVATGSAELTRRLRPLYAGVDVLIEDWLDFDAVLPQVDVFVCNGGSGSLLVSLAHGVPLVCAGTREGKNDNNAHIAYHGLGIDPAHRATEAGGPASGGGPGARRAFIPAGRRPDPAGDRRLRPERRRRRPARRTGRGGAGGVSRVGGLARDCRANRQPGVVVPGRVGEPASDSSGAAT